MVPLEHCRLNELVRPQSSSCPHPVLSRISHLLQKLSAGKRDLSAASTFFGSAVETAIAGVLADELSVTGGSLSPETDRASNGQD